MSTTSDTPRAKTRAIDEAANLVLATNYDCSAVHGPAVLRATLVKSTDVLAQRGDELPEDVTRVVGEVAAEAGVMEGQPAPQMHALLELQLEQVLPPTVPTLIERSLVEAHDSGNADPVFRFAAVIAGLVAGGGVEKKRDDGGTQAGPLARFLLKNAKDAKKP
jgi:hypothetical protein